jgi:hypothetical protein
LARKFLRFSLYVKKNDDLRSEILRNNCGRSGSPVGVSLRLPHSPPKTAADPPAGLCWRQTFRLSAILAWVAGRKSSFFLT